jgi:hypothetical protein
VVTGASGEEKSHNLGHVLKCDDEDILSLEESDRGSASLPVTRFIGSFDVLELGS